MTSRYPLDTSRFGSHGSKMATRRQKPKNPTTPQPVRSPSTTIQAPPTQKRAETTSVKILIVA